ncbi:DNA polymerase III subunit delta [Parapusillimonas granuli]|uniref:DNA polymerase III subunit delta n=1 Tax=Parapusillimonas granuli TaxID=380911 RepID=A0A853FRI4_9BURK|nr:DNA polymerase III subunit delta [Parapusillimonas granuli]MBB5213577.1 DNA polymerase-3 subunit delta [Parapusillimonas granuli]NYT48415.1 DNA polymerase III subunit delta [Parapusillimonas granuli]
MGRQLDPDSLIGQLRLASPPQLDTLYVVSGDEPLLVIETCDALRAAAARAGFGERISMTLDARSDWSSVIGATQNVSLFGDRRLVDVSIPSGKPGKTGADTLLKLAEMAGGGALADTMLLVSLPRLDRATRAAKWAQGLFGAATSVEISQIERPALPQWIAQRLARQNQQLDRETLEWMADKVEGNLLAAFQEIQKLGLLYPEGRLSAQDVEQAVLNVARYDVFGLRDAMLAGNPARALAILAGLRAEGEALPLVLWAVGDEVRVLARLAAAQAGGDIQAELRRQRVFGQREQLLRQALNRVPPGSWPAAVQHAHDIDRLIKGLKVPGRLDDPWEELGRLALRIAVSRPRKPRGVAA